MIPERLALFLAIHHTRKNKIVVIFFSATEHVYLDLTKSLKFGMFFLGHFFEGVSSFGGSALTQSTKKNRCQFFWGVGSHPEHIKKQVPVQKHPLGHSDTVMWSRETPLQKSGWLSQKTWMDRLQPVLYHGRCAVACYTLRNMEGGQGPSSPSNSRGDTFICQG